MTSRTRVLANTTGRMMLGAALAVSTAPLVANPAIAAGPRLIPTAGVTRLTATPTGNRCVRFRWGGTRLAYYERFQMRIGGDNAGTVFRWTGRRKALTVCKFPANYYTVWVRKTGTPWRTASFTVGNP